MIKVRYTGEVSRLLIHNGVPYEVSPGDEIDIESLPDAPGFEEVKSKPNKPPNKEETQSEGADV